MNENNIRNVYVVDDDIPSYQLIKEILSDDRLSVKHFLNGNDLLAIFNNGKIPDLVIMDIQLPDTDGLELTRQIKLLQPSLPVIAYTSFAMPGDRERCIGGGCDEYISKPIDVEKFFDVARRYLPGIF